MTHFQRCCLILLLAAIGCRSNENAQRHTEEPIPANPIPVHSDTAEKVAQDRDEQNAWNQIGKLYAEAKESGYTKAESASDWIVELYTGRPHADIDTRAWINHMYEDAKERGQTTASSAEDWIREDVRRMGAWEYKTIVSKFAEYATLEEELNRFGAERWECFWVDRQGDTAVFYLKRPSRSYLQSVPIKDLLRLLPVLGGGSPGE